MKKDKPSLMGRRRFLIAAGAASTSVLAAKKLSGLLRPASRTGAAKASETSGAGNIKYSKTIKTDIVVLGSGAGGMTAAIRAKQMGINKVLILEQRADVGGNSIFAPFPAIDKTADIQETFKTELENSHWRADGRMVGTMLVRAEEVSDFLKELAGKVPAGARDGALVKMLKEKCDKLGIQFMLNTRARKLIKDENDFGIVGVSAEQGGKAIKVEAKVTVLATGGFLGDPELMEKYFPYYNDRFYDEVHLEGHRYNGDGIKMGIDAGGADDGTVSFIWGPNKLPFFNGDLNDFPTVSFLVDNTKTPEALWVNIVPSRFVDESQPRATNVIYRQPHKQLFIVLDAGIVEYLAKKHPGKVSVEKLEKEMLPLIEANQALVTNSTTAIADWIKGKARIMKGCITDYNTICEKGVDDSFYKAPAFLVPFRKPPFYVFRSGLSLRHTQGALKVNPRMSVVMPYDNPVPFLMACGADIGGLHADLFLAGEESHSIEWTIASALIAGANAAGDVTGMGPSKLRDFPDYTAKEIMARNYDEEETEEVMQMPPGAAQNGDQKIYH